MQSENRLFDDFARMAEGALNALSGARSEFDALLRQQVEHFLASMNLVTREEYDTLEAMVAKSREAEEAMAARVAALEEVVARLAPAKAPARARAAKGGKTVESAAETAPDVPPAEEPGAPD